MNPITVQIESAGEMFAALKNDWQRLFSEAGCSPFMAWEWMSIWFEHFGGSRVPYIFTAFRGGNLIGILPMFLEKQASFAMRYNRLSLMGEGPGGADYLDLIAREEDRVDALKAIFGVLENEAHCALIRFENLAADSGTADLLRCLGQEKGRRFPRFHESVSALCPKIALADGWETVLSQSKRAANFKRRLRSLEKMPGFEFRSITSPDETANAFERFLRLHEKRWEREGGSELSGHPRLVSFQRRLIPELSRAGFIRFDELWVDGECRASVYGLDDKTTFYYYNSGYDLDYSRFSVGLVLLGLSIRNAVERGICLYDFLRGNEAYKFDWANQSTNLVNMSLNTSTFSSIARERFAHVMVGLQNGSKRVLPIRTKEMIGNWRRAWKRNYQMPGQ